MNIECKAKRASGRLQPIRVLRLRCGTGDAYRQHCVSQGQREAQFKLIRLCVRPLQMPCLQTLQTLPGLLQRPLTDMRLTSLLWEYVMWASLQKWKSLKGWKKPQATK